MLIEETAQMNAEKASINMDAYIITRLPVILAVLLR